EVFSVSIEAEAAVYRHAQDDSKFASLNSQLSGSDPETSASRVESFHFCHWGGAHRARLSAGPLSRYTAWQFEHASARSFVASETFSCFFVRAAPSTARPAALMSCANFRKSARCDGTGFPFWQRRPGVRIRSTPSVSATAAFSTTSHPE